MRTEKQAEASRVNGAQSKGPVTDEGKDQSKRNAVKTGLHGKGFVLPEHMETELLSTIAWLHSKLNPENQLEFTLTNGMALNLIQFDESVRLQIFRKLEVAQRTLFCWEDDRKLAAAEVADDLTKRPMAVSMQLSNSKHGCVVLLDLWAQFGTVLEAVGDWTDRQKSYAYDMLGVPEVLRGPGGRLHVPEGVDPKTYLKSVLDAEVARLTARRDGDLHEIDETERQQALLGNLPDDPTMTSHRRGGAKSLSTILKICKTMEVSLGRAAIAPKLNFPKRCRGKPRRSSTSA